MAGVPIKIGVLHDAPTINPDTPVLRGMALRLDDFNAQGGVQGRKVELEMRAANGAHDGLPENTVAAWRALAALPEVVGIIGPGITDNALAVVDVIQECSVPTINWSGTERARGEWYFQFQAGSLPDEGPYLARLIARLGHRRVGLLQTIGPVGDQYFDAFKPPTQDLGLEIASHQHAHVHATDVVPQLQRLREAKPDCLLFLGMGEPALACGRGVRALKWQVPRFGNIALLAVARSAEAVKANEGLIWTDQYEPRNPVLQRVEAAYRKRYRAEPPKVFTVAVGYDLIALMVEGLRRAPNLTRSGLKAGLERVRHLPCATGGVSPIMGFGPWDRAAIKGPDLLMFRTVRRGKLVTYELPHAPSSL